MSLITNVDIIDESKENFLTYAEEVLTDRAIPSAEDGLLSAQRKILWTMEDHLNMSSKSKTKKCNAIVGSTLSTSYFHGDQACYGVLTKMAQEFLQRYPLIDGQGSLGTQESNDMVASSRYTEAKPSVYADLMMADFKKNVVPLKETYNNEYMEPVVLPSLFPNALCNGKQAIGISMSHCSLPNNLTEVCDAIVQYINKPNISIDEIMTYLPGPDFPLENVVINAKDIKEAFMTGKSKVSLKVRGVYEIKGDKIIFTSIPYRVYRNKIKEEITKNIDLLSEVIDDFDDESNLGKNRLVFTCKAGISPTTAVNKLFALTSLQSTVSYNLNYVVNGTPRLCSIIDLIKAYYEHQINIILRATEHDKEKLSKRIHILKGMLVVLEDIDRAIELIKTSENKKEAVVRLTENFKLTTEQAEAILDMKLAKLTRLDRDELLKELEEKTKKYAECEKIISDSSYRDKILIDKITDLKNKYGDARRTQLLDIEQPKDEEKPDIVPEDVVVILNQAGEIKRIPKASFKVQKRNGKGVKSTDSAVIATLSTNTQDILLLFSTKGKMYRLLVDNIPAGTNVSKGSAISSLIKIDYDERIIATCNLADSKHAKYVAFVTKQGMFKKSSIKEYTDLKRNIGIQAIKLKDGDSIVNVSFINDEDYVLFTRAGYAIHFETTDIRAIGRITLGVKSIKLSEGDYVVSAVPLFTKDKIAIVAENGLGKLCEITEFPTQLYGGKGVMASSAANIVNAVQVKKDDALLIIGQPNSICIEASTLPTISRTASGNRIIKDTHILNVARL